MVMDERATYVSPHWDRADLYFRPGLVPPKTFEAIDKETGDPLMFTRISDDSLTCHSAYIEVKGKLTLFHCKSGEECHRRAPGVCQCGLHPDHDGRRGVQLERA